jgi:hypothetical protein
VRKGGNEVELPEVQFMIKANLQFPQDESFMGFHSAFANT